MLQIDHNVIYLKLPLMGGEQTRVHTPELKFQIWLSSGSDKCNLILWWKLSSLWKFEPDPAHLRGALSWISSLWYPRYMHSQYMYFELGMYFLMNTLLISLLVAPTLAQNMVYSLSSALLVKIWANLKAPPRRRNTGLLGPYTTPVTTAILDVILKPMQSDLVGYRLFSGQISGL